MLAVAAEARAEVLSLGGHDEAADRAQDISPPVVSYQTMAVVPSRRWSQSARALAGSSARMPAASRCQSEDVLALRGPSVKPGKDWKPKKKAKKTPPDPPGG